MSNYNVGGGIYGDRQIVVADAGEGDNAVSGPSSTQSALVLHPMEKAVTGTAVVEYHKSSAGGVVLREDEEDLEIKLRRIIDNVPVRVSNTSGSSAGSGSGDFHQYRQMRRKEQDRVTRMDADYQRRKEIAEFNMRREERLKEAEERTAKKRSKRQKKKQKKKEKKLKTISEGDEAQPKEEHQPKKAESSDKENSDSDEHY